MTAVHVSPASASDLDDVADVAARTFPLACPPSATAENIAAFIAANLSVEKFATHLADPARAVLVARESDTAVGYALLIDGLPDDEDVHRAVTTLPTIELSKIYVLPSRHGGVASAALMTAALDYSASRSASSVWLGVNQENARAQRFYAKHGFVVTGTKTFRLGACTEHDFVLTRRL